MNVLLWAARWPAIAALALLVLSCGDDSGTSADQGASDTATDERRRDIPSNDPPTQDVPLEVGDASQDPAVDMADDGVGGDVDVDDMGSDDPVVDTRDSAPDDALDINLDALQPGTVECPGNYGANNATDDYTDGINVGNDNVRIAWRYDLPEATPIRRIEIVTGDLDGVASRTAIWSNDGEADAPGTELAGGPFTIELEAGWQGAELDSPVVLAAGRYWVVWESVRDAQSNNQDAGDVVNVGYRTSVGGAAWSALRFAIWKLRLCR